MKNANVSTALNRWAVANSMKSELANSFLEMYGMSESSSGHKYTKESLKKEMQSFVKTQGENN